MQVKFCGEAVSARQLAIIADITGSCTGLSRTELASTVCELLDWRRANGGLKSRECWALLEQLEAAGELTLPARRQTKPKGARTRVVHSARGEPAATLNAPLGELTPLSLELVKSAEHRQLWRELVGRYHYQGHAVPYGAHLRYLVSVTRPTVQLIGCLQFSSAAWRLASRDQWIGWDDELRARKLQQVINNSRFLVLPWVQVRNLASAVLARGARTVAADWERAYAVRPLLLETLVDTARFAGTCYRAANWVAVGTTSGRGRDDRYHERHGHAPKAVFVYPLARHARARLRHAEHASLQCSPACAQSR